MFRYADDAAFAEVDADASECAGVLGHGVVDGVEDADGGGGAGAGLTHVEAAFHAVLVVGEVYVDVAGGGVDGNGGVDADADFGGAGDRVVDGDRGGAALGHSLNGGDHAFFGVVEPLFGEGVEGVPADLFAEGEDLAFADAGGADHGEEIAVPLLGDADAHLAHADDVLVEFVVFLHLDGGEDQCAFLVYVAGGAVVGGGDGVADVGLVGLGEDGEVVLAAFIDDGHEDGVIGGVRAAVVRRVVEEGVAALERGVKLLHGLGHEVGAAEDVDGEALLGGEEFAVAGDDATGEVLGAVEDAGAAGAEEGVAHFSGDAFEAVVDDGELGAVEGWGGVVCHGGLPIRCVRGLYGWRMRLPALVRRKVDAGSATMVVKGDSMMAGPWWSVSMSMASKR